MSALAISGAVARPTTFEHRTGKVADFLAAARPLDDADHGTVIAAADGYRASIPLHELAKGSLTDGRLIVPGGRTLCWNVKDVVRIEVTVGPQPDDVPENPPH